MSKITKKEMAEKIVNDNPNATRKEIIELFISQLGMSKAGATTYAYNLSKGTGKVAKKAAPEATITVEVAKERAKDMHKEERLAMMKKVLAKMKIE